MAEDVKATPNVVRYLWERRNKLYAESKKLEWILEKEGEKPWASDMTLRGMVEEIAEYDYVLGLLKKE